MPYKLSINHTNNLQFQQFDLNLLNCFNQEKEQLLKNLTYKEMSQKYLKTVIYVSIVILVYQGISNSDLGIISQLTHQNGNDWAGPLSTALLFTGSGMGSMYNKYIGKIQFRFCFFIGSFGYTIFIAMGLIFMKLGFSVGVQIAIFVGSLLAGVACSVFYNTQFNFINTLSKIDDRHIKYFGINMGLSQSSSIFGNVLSSLLIKPLGQFYSVLVMEIIVFVTSLFFLLLKDPDQFSEQLIEEYEQKQKQSIKDENEQTVIREVNLRPPFSVCCCFAFTGIIISFVFSFLSIILYRTFEHTMSQTQLNHLTFVIFIFEGIGEFLGGIFMIFFSKKIKDYAKSFMITSSLFMTSVIIIFIGSQLESIYIIGAGVVLTGFSDCSSFVSALSLAGLWKQNGISFFNLSQCTTVALTVMFMVFVPYWLSIVWMSIYFIVNLTGLFIYRKTVAKIQEQVE